MNTVICHVGYASLMLFTAFCCLADSDQRQTASPRYQDWGDGCGQSFTAARSGILAGIDICIQNSTHPGSAEIYLWKTDSNGKPIEPKLTTAFLDKGMLGATTTAWYTVQFQNPYTQTSGDRLGFTIHPTTSGTKGGYNNYGYATNDLYPSGSRIYYLSGSFVSYPASDWAFRTHLASAPQLRLGFGPTSQVSVCLSSPDTNVTYVIQSTGDLARKEWRDVVTNRAPNGVFTCALERTNSASCFFRAVTPGN